MSAPTMHLARPCRASPSLGMRRRRAAAADPPTVTRATRTSTIRAPTRTRGHNLVWLAPAHRRVGKLLVFLPLGGAANLPTEFEEFGSEAGRLGYHTIVLAYRNEVPIANAAPAGTSEAPPPPRRRTARSTRAWRSSTGRQLARRHGRSRRTASRTGSTRCSQHLAADLPRRRLVAVHRRQRTSPSGRDRDRRRVARRRPGRPDRVAALGAPRGVVRRLDRCQARLGQARSDAGGAVLLADPRARHLLPRTCFAYAVWSGPTCPQTCFPSCAVNPQPAAGREPPAAVRDPPTRVQPRARSHRAERQRPYHPSTTRDRLHRQGRRRHPPSPKLVNFWRSTLGDSDADSWLDERRQLPARGQSPTRPTATRNKIGDACGPTFARARSAARCRRRWR